MGGLLLIAIAQRLRAVVRDKNSRSAARWGWSSSCCPGANARWARTGGETLEASRQHYQIDYELTIAPRCGQA